jgi:hypothetical protein
MNLTSAFSSAQIARIQKDVKNTKNVKNLGKCEKNFETFNVNDGSIIQIAT